MSPPPLWALMVTVALSALSAAVLLLLHGQRTAQLDARIQALRAGRSHDAEVTEKQSLLVRVLSRVGNLVLRSGLLSKKTVSDFEQTIVASGRRPGPALPLFLGGKLVLLIGLPMVGWLVTRLPGVPLKPLFVVPICAVVGMMLPDFIFRTIRQRYLAAVESGMPAALDLLIICAEAGLALEASLERVAEESRKGTPATANELRITSSEMRILPDRRQALVNMGVRTGLVTMTRLGGTLAQSLKYGTPLSQALRTLAVEMRQLMLTRYEAKAARIPVLLTIPMIIFILPCVFIVVGGPAVVRVMHLMVSQ